MCLDPELRRTLWSLVAFPKLKRQLLLMDPIGLAPKDFTENTSFWINQDFAIIKNGRIQRRGKVSYVCALMYRLICIYIKVRCSYVNVVCNIILK